MFFKYFYLNIFSIDYIKMENNIKCKFCKKGLMDIKDDWINRQFHKHCWKENQKLEDLISYFKTIKYVSQDYKLPAI